MPLKAAVKSLDELGTDEGLKKLYREDKDSGLFVLDVESSHGWGNEDITGLKNTVGTLRGQVEEATRSLKDFDGLDPKKARDALKKVEEFGKIDPTKEADRIAQEKFEALKSQLVTEHQNELGSVTGRLDKYKGNLTKLAVDNEIDRAVDALIAEQGLELQPGAKDDLRLLVKQSIKADFDDEAGSIRVKIVDDKGVERIGDGKGNPMNLNQFVAELPKSRPFFFSGKGATGQGSTSQPGNSSPGSKRLSEMSGAEKGKFIAENGLQKFQEGLRAERAARSHDQKAGA